MFLHCHRCKKKIEESSFDLELYNQQFIDNSWDIIGFSNSLMQFCSFECSNIFKMINEKNIWESGLWTGLKRNCDVCNQFINRKKPHFSLRLVIFEYNIEDEIMCQIVDEKELSIVCGQKCLVDLIIPVLNKKHNHWENKKVIKFLS